MTKIINIDLLEPNKGQIEGLPKNPRLIKDDNFYKLKKSLEDNPEMLYLRELLVYEHESKFVIIGGNMRYFAAKELGYSEMPCKIIPKETPIENLRAYIIKDNVSFGEYDWDLLANEWDAEELSDWGLEVWQQDEENNNESGATPVEKHGDLKARFIVPPFSILDTKQVYWQERKKSWLEITGNLSETRDGEFGKVSGGGNSVFDSINNGTSNFDPVLAEIMILWFCPKGGKILDPFGGEQTKGVVAGTLGHPYQAVEFRTEQVALNMQKCKNFPGVQYYVGDSNNISEIIKDREFNFCLTSPPYYDLEVYSKDDMSSIGTYEEFMAQYENIFRQCYDMLADNSFLVIKISEIRDKKTGIYRNFVGDNITIFQRIGFNYYNEIILANSIGTAAFRANNAMANRKICKIHQNVLVFYKGNPDKIKDNFTKIDYKDEDLEMA
jgi:DNA modification methylase